MESFDEIFDKQARLIIAKLAKNARVVFEDGKDTGSGRVKVKNKQEIIVNSVALNGSRIKSYVIISCLKKARRL